MIIIFLYETYIRIKNKSSKGEVAKPLPKALDGLTFLLRSLNGYAGSMPLHSILKDPAHFTFLYGVPSPSCRSTKETNFEGNKLVHKLNDPKS